ncbi:MAG: hypothetical protein PHQ36_03490, partial [Anaerolineales bacterium]|nr:hypothetical protein [Anaerolineales bacterium]
MKKYIQYLIAIILTASVVGVARNSPAWASPKTSNEARPNFEIVVTQDGKYTVGGICDFTVAYNVPNISDKAAVDVPAEVSREVPFSYPDNLYLSGCHIIHYKDNQFASEMTATEGDWEVCFGNRPDEKLTIYYYPDDLAATGQAAWLPLPTTEKDTYVCAPAMHSGVYAPGGVIIPRTGETANAGDQTTVIHAGTVIITTANTGLITKPGKYGAGGICEMTVDYYVPNLTNELHVEENV